jgi:diguanylate cyclase (GGDEF)-like protein
VVNAVIVVSSVVAVVAVVVALASGLQARRSRRELETARERVTLLDRRVRDLLEERRRLQESLRSLEGRARIDSRVDLPDRTAFLERLDVEWRRARRRNETFAVVLAEIPIENWRTDLQQIVVRKVADELKRAARRGTDVIASLGGGRFALLLGDTPRDGARHVASRIRMGTGALDSRRLPDSGPPLAIEVGFGQADPRKVPSPEVFMEHLESGLERSRTRGGMV